MNKKARRSARRIGLRTTELMLSAPFVITHRLARMRTAGSQISVRDRREFQRMGVEKVAAFGESWNQMALQMLRANQQITQAWMAAWSLPARRPFARIAAQMQDSALRVIGSGLAPVHRRATANARRLRRAKTR